MAKLIELLPRDAKASLRGKTMQLTAEFGEAVAIFRDNFLGGTIEALIQEIEVLIKRLQFRLG